MPEEPEGTSIHDRWADDSQYRPVRTPAKNPYYEGATVEDVARALLRAPRAGGEPVVGDEVAVEQPAANEPGDDGGHLG